MSLIFGLVFCSVGKATPNQDDQRVVFYVFGSEDIYIVDPKSKAILSTIGPDGVCTKSNNRYSRWACLNNNVCRNFSHSLPWCKYISRMRGSVSSPDETRLKDWEESWKYDAQAQRSILTNFEVFHLVMKPCVAMLDFTSQTLKMILQGEIKDAKMSSFSSDFQTLIKH